MTKRLTEAEVQANLPELLESLKENYDEIIVTRNNIAVARITPTAKTTGTDTISTEPSVISPLPNRGRGMDKGKFVIPEDAFAPMTAEELAEWGMD
jgi:antitoxin (DNA-binding transcriptional repressor) of toxin-antitoxin stability system